MSAEIAAGVTMKIENRPVVGGQKPRFLPACARASAGWLPKAPQAAFGQ
jgi:hypothetical protein